MLGRLAKLAIQAAGLVLMVVLLASWPSYRWGGSENLQAMLAGAGLTLVVSIISLIPMAAAVQRRADWLGQACLGATVIRLLGTLVAGMGWYLLLRPRLAAFALWTMLFYLILLAWETKTAMGYIRLVYGEPKKTPYGPGQHESNKQPDDRLSEAPRKET
ncbi:MAG: hypothetical protein JW810_14085 [Sedimentisphaerales bacterium]|nr:hypothetical protein [Sedimentisphaerales bacterium]